MNTLSKNFIIELTADEVDVIATALHGQYKHNKEMLSDKPINPEYITKHMVQAKELRNTFANLLNRQYLGEDA